MRIISLSSSIAGPACSIACSIKKHFYKEPNSYPTNFFDYLETSLISINQILTTDNIKDKLNTNFNKFINIDNNTSIKFNNFHHIISHHDLPLNYSEEDFQNLIEKYNRRLNRIINYIKTEDKIFFIRYGLEKQEDINNFIKIIKNINPNLEYLFLNIIYDPLDKTVELFDKNYILINFNNYIDKSKIYSENLFDKIMEFDWSIVIKLININH